MRVSSCSVFFLQTLIVDLTRSLDEPQDSANLQIAVLSFYNAIINYKGGQVSSWTPSFFRARIIIFVSVFVECRRVWSFVCTCVTSC